MYALAGASVGALAPAALRLPAGSVVGALAPLCGSAEFDNLPRSGGRPGDRNGTAGVRRRGGARARAPVCAGRTGRWRARARQTVRGRRLDNLRRNGGRPGDRNISAHRGERGGARAREAVRAGRIDRRRGRSRQTISAGRVDQVSSGASLMVEAGRGAVRIERHENRSLVNRLTRDSHVPRVYLCTAEFIVVSSALAPPASGASAASARSRASVTLKRAQRSRDVSLQRPQDRVLSLGNRVTSSRSPTGPVTPEKNSVAKVQSGCDAP